RQIVERHRTTQRARLLVRRKREPCGKLNRPEGAEAVVGERLRIDDTEHAPLDVAAAVERILVLPGQRIPEDRVDAKITPATRLSDGHVRVAGALESLVSASGFRVAPRQRDIEIAELEHLKAGADGFDASERLEKWAQPIDGQAEDLDVDVLRL